MNRPPTLFDPPAVRTSDTSQAAARAVKPRAKGLRAVVVAAFVDAGAAGLTDQEASERTGIAGDTLRPRRCELARSGVIRKTDRRRPTPRGGEAAVWVVTTAAEGGAA